MYQISPKSRKGNENKASCKFYHYQTGTKEPMCVAVQRVISHIFAKIHVANTAECVPTRNTELGSENAIVHKMQMHLFSKGDETYYFIHSCSCL